MKAKNRSLGNWIVRRFKEAPAQSMVEFAMALPVLLLATFGVIEFGRLLQAWLALENGARFGARYAVTGEYNVGYCDEAGAALGLTNKDLDENADGTPDSGATPDCKVEPVITLSMTPDEQDEVREKARVDTQALQDWARLPSIRDAALSGASGIAYADSVSGDYQQYLVDSKSHGTTFSSDYRGDPSKPGFFMISTCSNRISPALTGTAHPTYPVFLINDPALDASLARYYPGHDGEDEYQYYPTLCAAYNKIENPPGTFTTHPQYYMDDAGGPGDRVRITLTYRHNMIMPLLSDWWPTLRLNTSRDGVVEKFRTSRVTGLSEGNMNPDTPTFTSTNTSTPSVTSTVTDTATVTNTATDTATATVTSTSTALPTNTGTATRTATLQPCPDVGNGIRAEYYNTGVSGVPANPFTSPIFVLIEPNVNHNWGNGSPGTGIGSDYFSARYVGEVISLASETYTFYITTDDGGRLWVNNSQIINAWSTHSATEYSGTIALTRCQKYPIVMEFFESGGSAVAELRWSSASQSKEIIPQVNLIGTLSSAPSTATITPIPTRTNTNTITLTFTRTLSPTRTPIPPTSTVTRTRAPTRTRTNTLIPSKTNTRTDVPPTSTRTNTLVPTNTRTITPIPANTYTRTVTPIVPTKTPTVTNTPKGIGG